MADIKADNKKPRGRKGGKWFQKVKKEFEEELLQVARVTKVTRGWRTLRFRATVVIWDKKWRVGIWVGKSWEVVGAIEKAVNRAKKTMVTLPIIKGTIPKEVKTKFKSAIVFLHPASDGTGIIAGWPTRRILELAGYKNVLGKRYGSTNIINNAFATMQALQEMSASVNKQEELAK